MSVPQPAPTSPSAVPTTNGHAAPSSAAHAGPSTAILPDVRTLTTYEEITARLALLARRESDLTLALNALISDRSHIDNALSRLRTVGMEVERLSVDVDGGSMVAPVFGLSSRGLGQQNGDGVFAEEEEDEGLVGRVQRVWETSERVGGKVRRLDTEISRIREATDIVTEVMELKNALQTCSNAIAKEDWESAARACKRAMSIRKDVINGGYAGQVVPTAQQPFPPPQILEDLRNTLLHTFRVEFNSAAERKDQQAVSRFFRLWPGIEAEEEGLEAYGNFVVDLVKARNAATAGKPSSPVYYLTQLTSLLESIAHIIDQHQPVVDKYYGTGRMRKVVQQLVQESDRVLRGLVEGWEEERRVGRLILDTKQTKFPLLSNPSIAPPLYPSLVNPSTPQLSVAAIANTASSHLTNISSATSLLQQYAPGAKKPVERTTTPQPVVEEEPIGPDPRDIDKVLGELVALGGRWALFRRFVHGRLTEEDEQPPSVAEDANGDGQAQMNDDSEAVPKTAPKPNDTAEAQILEQSGSHKALQNLLRVYYEPLELWFFRMSLEKAHRLDTPDVSSKPHVSSLVDDTFYLLKSVIGRTLSCGSIATLRAMRTRISDTLERDYTSIIRRKMEAVYGGQTSTEKDREKSRDQRSAFIIYLNDLDLSAEYMDRLMQSMQDSLPQVFLPHEVEEVKAELNLLGETSGRLRNASKTGLEQLFNQLTRPRLRGVVDDCYKDMTYLLDEDSFAEAEELDVVRHRFQRAWNGLMEGYKDALTDHNYQAFFNLTVETLVRPWEKVVMGMRFNELGAIRYERDIRAIANYLGSQTSFGGVREKFTRLQQIGTVLNMDAEEDPEEFYSNSGIPWRISKAEFNAVIDQRQ